MTEREVRNLIRSHAEQAGSVRALAKQWGMSQGYLDKQIRGTMAIGDKTLRRLKLIRRKTYQFYPASRVGLNDLASEVGAMIADHESWREANDVVQRSQGQGSPMTSGQVAKLLGITPKDLQRLLDNDSGFPEPDAHVLRKPAWQGQTIYAWLLRKGLKAVFG
jgi:hypothetical protein